MHDQRPHRVQHHISTDIKQMTLLLNKSSFVSSLENMSNVPMTPFKAHGINTVQMAHLF
jgi:hypothetical protein